MSTAIPMTPGQSTGRGRPLRRMQLRVVAATSGAAMLLPVAPLLALAGPDPGDPVTRSPQQTVRGVGVGTTPEAYCPLRRVDRQLVRCDDLTGNGTAAPDSIPERR